MNLKLQNFFASSGFLLFFYSFYSLHPYFAGYFSSHYFFLNFDISVTTVFFFVVLFYLMALGVLYFFDSTYTKSKSLLAWIALKKICSSHSINEIEKIALLSILLKGFYAPLMVTWFVGHSVEMFFICLMCTNTQI